MMELTTAATHADGLAPVELVRSGRARRVSLRWLPATGRFRLTLPPRVSLKRAQAFVDEQRDWMRRQAAARPAQLPVAFALGAALPLLGVPHVVEAAETGRLASIENGRIRVPGPADLHAGRIRRALIDLAAATLTRMSAEKATRIGLAPRQVRVREMRSRWGSCAIDGALCYNWRLILAPAEVADYVVAHEVAHLRHHDHSDPFWNLCFELADSPGFGRDWLRREGSTLFRYGAPT